MRQFLTWIDYLVTCAVVFTLFWQTFITVLKKLPKKSHFLEFCNWSEQRLFEFSRPKITHHNVFWVIFKPLWFIQVEGRDDSRLFSKINNAFIVKMISLSCKKAKLLVLGYLKCLQKWLNHGLGKSKVEQLAFHEIHSAYDSVSLLLLKSKRRSSWDQWTIKNEIDLWQMISIHCKWLGRQSSNQISIDSI